MRFDLLVKGGRLVDPAAGRDGPFDVAVLDGRIAAVDRGIPADSADEVRDASGLIVTPGLVDLHTHVYPDVTFWGVDADALASRGGVTTCVDAGSAGALTLAGFRRLAADPCRVRVLAFLNISAIGLVAQNFELANLAYCDAELLRRVARENRDLVVGVKVRIGTPTVGDNGTVPLERAVAAAEALQLPVMVHIAFAPPAIDEVVERLRPGDVLTHCFTGSSMRIADQGGRLRESVERAIDRGVVLDLGHGSGSFAWSTAEPLMEAGHAPAVISSDAHQLSVNGPMFDLPTCMTKLMTLGMSLHEAVQAATTCPAELLGLDGAGTLSVGAPADIAILSIERGSFALYDAHLERRDSDVLLRAVETIAGGVPLEPAPLGEPPSWIRMTEAQRRWREGLERGEVERVVDRPAAASDYGEPFPRDAPPV